MTPGAAPDGNFGLVSFRGISGLLNNNTVDGGDNTQAFFAEERGRTRLAYSVSADAVREFQVTTSNYSAEYGRAAGGVVNAVTKSGTNELHGSGFYFLRDNKWGATNPFQTQTVLVNGVSTTVQLKPKDRRQQFGGTVGGPIQKDKVFFFFSYDQQARNFPGVAAPSNPTAFFAPFTAAELATFADARHYAGAGRLTASTSCRASPASCREPATRRSSCRRSTGQLNNNHSLAVTYNRLRWDSPAGVQTAAVVNRGVESWGNDGVNDDWTTARFNSVLGSRMTNEVRFQWGRDFEFQSSQDPTAGRAGVGAAAGLPQVDISGTGGLASASRTSSSAARIPTSAGSTSATCSRSRSGSHLDQDRRGLQPRLRHAGQPVPGSAAPTPTAAASTSSPTTQHRPRAAPRATTPASTRASGRRAFTFHTFDYDVFIQDTWHVNPRTTLNLGLRYDYEKMPEPQIPNPLLPATSAFPKDKNNFGPRIGVAYDLSGHGQHRHPRRLRHVLRPHHQLDDLERDHERRLGVGSARAARSRTPRPARRRFPNVLASASATPVRPDVVVFGDDTQNPLVHEWDADLRAAARRRARWCRCRTSAAPAATCRSSSTRTCPQPSGTVTYAAIGGPLDGQTVTTPIFTGARPNANFGRITTISRPWSTRSTTGWCCS